MEISLRERVSCPPVEGEEKASFTLTTRLIAVGCAWEGILFDLLGELLVAPTPTAPRARSYYEQPSGEQK